MPAVQNHGFLFEQWVRDTFFGGYLGTYTQHADIPKAANKLPNVPEAFRHLLVSVKISKYGSPLALGDALRQISIDEPFIIIAAFWRQRTPAHKWIEEIGVARFTEESWDQMWGKLSRQMVTTLDEIVKNHETPYRTARQEAQTWKDEHLPNSESKIVLNPKIGTTTQRRLQCSLPFDHFWEAVGRKPEPKQNPTLFGTPFPNPIPSEARVFKP